MEDINHVEKQNASGDYQIGSWELHFDNDGTENVGVIYDAAGEELVTSRPFWLPTGTDPIPPTLAALRTMRAAPVLLAALQNLLERTDLEEGRNRSELTEPQKQARQQALTAIAEATSGSPEGLV